MRPLHVALAALALLLWARPRAAAGDDAPTPTAALPAPGTGAPPARATPLAVLEGRVRAVDLGAHAVDLDVSGRPVSLRVDRNTLVYLPTGLSTVSALHPGDEVRAGRNDRGQAYWIEVRRAPAPTAPAVSTPGQGTGPGGGTPAPAERPGAATPPAGTGTTVP